MRIAFLLNDKAGVSTLTTGLAWLHHLAGLAPQSQFLLLTNKESLPAMPPNVEQMPIPSMHRLFSIPAKWAVQKLLKRWQPDLLIGLEDAYYIHSDCPQLILFTDAADKTKNTSTLRLLRNKVNYAVASVFPSAAAAAAWRQLLKLSDEKTYSFTPLPFSFFTTVTADQKKQFQLDFTAGREFFLVMNELQTEEEVINLLKAFSVFKGRQQTNMKLVIPIGFSKEGSSFAQKLATYKFRDDIVVISHLTIAEKASLAASAYALIITSSKGAVESYVMEALQVEQPFLLPRTVQSEEFAGPAALYTAPDSLQDLAEKMMLIYKDETLRSRLILQGRQRRLYLMENTSADKFQNLIHSFAS